jgi:hypothetical protein
MTVTIRKCAASGCNNNISAKSSKAKFCSDKCKVAQSRFEKKLLSDVKIKVKKSDFVDPRTAIPVLKEGLTFPAGMLKVTGEVAKVAEAFSGKKKSAITLPIDEVLPGTSDVLFGRTKPLQPVLPAWAQKVSNFCQKYEITPDDLMNFYISGGSKKPIVEQKPKTETSNNYLEHRRKLKGGA